MSGAPGFFIQRSLASFFKGKTTETPIDITGGIAISQLSQKETLEDRLRSGRRTRHPNPAGRAGRYRTRH